MENMTKGRFDKAIRKNVVEKDGEEKLGYVIEGKEPYTDYYSREEFKVFVDEMESKYNEIFKKYDKCVGKEMIEKDGVPPKMASVASSSRFCYLALRDGAQALGIGSKIEFEHKCKITGIKSPTHPQLDAYIEESNTYIEVKCHEIFDTHADIVMSKQYEEYICDMFKVQKEKYIEGDKLVIPISEFGIKKKSNSKTDRTRFDVKQLLCHLFGVKSEMGKEKFQEATLMYLFFWPKSDAPEEEKQINEVFKELKEEIDILFKKGPIREYADKNNIKLKAYAQHSKVMEGIKEYNIKDLMENE